MTQQSEARTAGGELLYARANDARRNGDHAAYNSICEELIAYNRRAALAKTGGA